MRPLAKGENALLMSRRLQLRVTASVPVDVCALLLASDGKVATDSDFVFYNQPSAAGIALVADGVDLDLNVLTGAVDRVICAVSVDEDQPSFSTGSVVKAILCDRSGSQLFEFIPVGLGGERAVIVFEIYRRQQTWKVRAVGQGYDGGLATLVAAHGIEVVRPPEPTARLAVQSGRGSRSPEHTAPQTVQPGVGSSPPGTTSPERQLRVLAAIFEDAARSAAAYRSAVTFAVERHQRELHVVFDDPRLRESASPSRQQADERYAELVTRATADHRRDVDQLAGELRDLLPSLPAALAPWDSAVWQAGRFDPSAGVRAGELHLPEAPDLRIPLVLAMPLRRPLWLHGARHGDRTGSTVEMARALIIRLLAADNSIRLQLCDSDGSLVAALGDLAAPAGGLLGAPVARTGERRSETLRLLVDRVDLLEMARDAGALDELPPIDSKVLLVITDVPLGFDDTDLRRLVYLVEHGPAAGLLILLLGDPQAPGPSAAIAQASLRLGAVVGEDISDGWVGMAWTFTPDFGPTDPASIVFKS